ncbi:MAG: transcriptional regulator [Candidatus Hodarchaeota archaeon]
MTDFEVSTRRERIVEILRITDKSGMTIMDISERLDAPVNAIIEDLRSITKSCKHKNFDLLVRPPECSLCGFKFVKSLNPSKCPSCKQKRIEGARIALVPKKRKKKKK